MIDERAEHLKALRAVPVVARSLTAAFDERAIRRRPADGEWAAVEVLAHMAETDECGLGRIERMLAEDDPELPGFDQVALTIEQRTIEHEAGATLDRLERAIGALVQRVEALDDAGWRRTGRHAEHGPITVEALVAHMAGEDVDHLAQIARLVTRPG